MPRQIELINNGVYQICYRAVGDAIVFKDNDDHYRGIFSLYEFNNVSQTEIWLRRIQRKREKLLGSPTPQQLPIRNSLVEIWTFCFMPNHIHLLLKQIKNNGISQFMKKLGGGYANYFNKKYDRRGHLFNQFKAVPIANEEQLKNVATYIHCNPISIIDPGWKEKGITEVPKTLSFLEDEYRWSSLWDYIKRPNFASVTNRDFLLSILEGTDGVKEEIKNWVSYNDKRNSLIREYNNLLLE